MIYHWSNKAYESIFQYWTLQNAGIVLGIILLVTHLLGLLKPGPVQSWLKKFPRNTAIGICIFSIDLIWALWIVTSMDLGEFHTLRLPLQIVLPVTFALVVTFVDEFLAVRALGILFLLAACPFLDAAYLQEPSSRVFLPLLMYVWILFALFWVGMPYLLRDQINWACKTKRHWTALCGGGIAYGVIVLICSFAFYGV